MSDEDRIPGVEDALLAQSVSGLPGFPNVKVASADCFAQSVRRLVETRAQAGWPEEGRDADVAAFVLVPRPREYRRFFGSRPIVDPEEAGGAILGKLLLLARDGTRGEVLEMPCGHNELFDWLVARALGDAPLVLAYRRRLTMTFRLRGVERDVSYKVGIREQPPELTPSSLEKALEQFHGVHLVTPNESVQGLWQRELAESYVPGPRPERSIQRALVLSVTGWFQGRVRAEGEDRTNIGRIDVRLLAAAEDDPLAYWAIVELKVIKSFSSAVEKRAAKKVPRNKNVEAIKKGLKQAWAYQHNRRAEVGVLEIYDMRADKTDNLLEDQGVEETFSALKPPVPACSLRPLYGSAELARSAGETGI